MPIHLLAMEKSAKAAPADEAKLRAAIINVTNYFLRMAATRSPSQMEAIIWHHDSIDGVDHGESCAAFASLTLELASQAVGQQSWVTGGTSYPWPLHKWADVRVDPNPDSIGIVSVLQDAQAHHRWHPLGDGYQPKPGDWVLFDGHVEVVTRFAAGVLDTVGGDSLPNFSVNGHTYNAPLAGQGVVGFVNNGQVAGMTSNIPGSGEPVSGAQGVHASHGQHGNPAGGQAGRAAPGQGGHGSGKAGHAGSGHPARDRADGRAAIPGAPTGHSARMKLARSHSNAAIPGLPVPSPGQDKGPRHQPRPEAARTSRLAQQPRSANSGKPAGGPSTAAAAQGADAGAAAIPGLPTPAPSAPASAAGSSAASSAGPAGGPVAPSGSAAPSAAPYGRHLPEALMAPVNDTHAEQAFINEVAAGAMAAQRRYGVPASVTIAQAIDESGWGMSSLATKDHNLFGIKGAGPAGSDLLATQEYQNGQFVTLTSPFRIYYNVAESINDHGKLLATSPYYRNAMANRQDPNAFAAALTGVYATDPQYGTKLIGIMQHYDLYRYNNPAPGRPTHNAPPRTFPGRPAPHSTPRATPPAHTPPAPSPGASKPGRTPPTGTPTAPPPTGQPTPRATTPGSTPHSPTPAPTPRTTQPAPTPRTTGQVPASRSTAPGPRPHTAPEAPGVPGPGRTPPAARPRSQPAETGGMAGAPQPAIPGVPDSVAAPPTGTARHTGAAPPIGTARQAGAGPRMGTAPRTGTALQAGTAPQTGTAPRTATAPHTRNAPQAHTAPGTGTAPRTGNGPRTGTAPRTPSGSQADAGTRTGTNPQAGAGAQVGRSTRTAAPQRGAEAPGAAGSSRTGAAPRAASGSQAAPSSPAPAVPSPRAEPAPGGQPQGYQDAVLTSAMVAGPSHGSSPLDRQKHQIASHRSHPSGRRYHHHIPPQVWTALITTARTPLLRAEPLYRDVADHTGIRWELLAACDWMQCKARAGYSPVRGEKLGTVNPDGTIYHTKSEALEQCAEDLVDLADSVYRVNVIAAGDLSIRDLACVFAAFRWGGLLKLHHTSAMEFPYSVAGLTAQNTNMRWPKIDDPNTPDKPGGKFRNPFGAVPLVLSLNYPATV